MQESVMPPSITGPENPSSEAASEPLVRVLSRSQRRVLGVLVEKAFTTPEYYPMTLKAITAGCNQKSNRSPVTNYSEDSVEETLGELRQLGLIAVIHTESGRTERYRHHMRQRYPFSEPQLAIVTELLLRGRQQLGELRSCASRMVPIDGLDELREALRDLQETGFVQSTGPLERRGIEVDQAFYPPSEGHRLEFNDAPEAESSPEPAVRHTTSARADSGAASRADAGLQHRCDDLQRQITELADEMRSLSEQFTEVRETLGRLERDLGS